MGIEEDLSRTQKLQVSVNYAIEFSILGVCAKKSRRLIANQRLVFRTAK